MLGQTVSHYRILKKLGEGGMGVVYEAEDLLLGRHVAIKFLTDTRREPQFRARFLREARAASALSHSHIAVIYDYGEVQEGDPFIVMELVDGQSLDDLLCAGEPLPIARAVEIAEQVAEALAEAHSHGVVHRDIKPSNIIIDEDGEVKVLDFGLAKQLKPETAPTAMLDSPTLLDARTASNVIIGTPMYLSPEQALARPVDGRSDLFALGAVLYECLTGRPAFRGATVVEICAQVLHVDPPPPSQINPRIPPELDEIILKVLAKQPAARQQTAEEFLADLRAVRTLPPTDERANTLTLSGFYTAARSGAHNLRRAHWRQPRFFIPLLLALVVAGALAWRVMPAGWLNGRAAPVVSPEALSWYERGTNALRDGSYFQASKMLEQAVSADDNFALAHARLAEAWMELDYTDRARDSILHAESLERERPGLPKSDRLYLTAINAAVRRDFPAAIKAYAALANLGQDKAQVHIDLGRAYEKNDEIDKAIESYTTATNLSQQYAAPFLRLGILYGRKQELASAAVFAKAEAIYQASGNLEGVTEVHYQRGALANRLRRRDEAREHLQRALNLAQATDNKYQQISALLELSHSALSENDLSRAQQLATQAIESSQSDQMESLNALALIALGNAYFVGGESSKAEDIFKKSLASAQRYKGRRNEATARFMIGSVLINRGAVNEGVPYIEQSLAFFQPGNYRKEAMQAQYLIGLSKRATGEYTAALQAFEQHLQLARQLNDQNQMSVSHEGLGVTLLQQEHYPEALVHFKESLALSRSLGEQIGIGYSLMNIGNALWRLGHYAEAREMFERAFALASRPSELKSLLAEIRIEQAGMALSERRYMEARTRSEQALKFIDAEDLELAVQAKQILCQAMTLLGEKTEGRRLCDEALALAARSGHRWAFARVQLALAEVLLESGELQQASSLARGGQEQFTRTGQMESAWRAWLIAARASQLAGDQNMTREYTARASDSLVKLEQQWGTEAFKQFLTRPDVRHWRQLFELSTKQL